MYEIIKTSLKCHSCGTEQKVEITNNIHLTEEDHEQIKEFGCLYGECSNCV